MKQVRKVVEVGLSQRKEKQIKVRQPLAEFRVQNSELILEDERLMQLIKDELNVKNVVCGAGEGEITGELDTTLTPTLIAEGKAREIVRSIQEKRKSLETSMTEEVIVTLPGYPEEFVDYIRKNALVAEIILGDTFDVQRR